eukprot:TRINITY_DN5198_c0_g1_i5.p1 TRINITY_DN5198_c0_g1~~TRINITY_DN5198_c0_g1_i5.p1  ORF type:complete len:414 (-),score=54.90 TRINITY_DN5198_c0_g1_i5:864-2105(-)
MQRQYDICVLGATGFTGERVLKYLSIQAGTNIEFAAAGRSQGKLEKVIQKLGLQCGIVSGVDANVDSSVLEMCQKCNIVLNCVGPYRYTGEVVVKACIQAKTNYLDVCGEPEFMERIAYQYQKQAQEAGIYVASAVGFDSVPADMGVVFAKQQFKSPAVPQSIQSYLTLISSKYGLKANYATWESAVQGFGSYKNLKNLRVKAKQDGLISPINVPGPKPPKSPQMQYDKRLSAWIFPFPGADAAVVRRSEAYCSSKQLDCVHYSANISVPSTFYAFILAFMYSIISTLAKFKWGRNLLLRYPGFFTYDIFTKGGPSQKQIENTRFEKTMFVSGYAKGPPENNSQKPDMHMKVKISGPEPGYVTTPIVLVQAAKILLEEKLNLPEFGVHTPASLLAKTSYIQKLQQSGISFQIL